MPLCLPPICSPFLNCYLHALLTEYPIATLRAADPIDADQNSSSTPAPTKVYARLGPHVTTLPLPRRSAATPLGIIDYNINIPITPAAAAACSMALQPYLLTPAQAALAHALGMIQGRAYAMP